MKSKVTVSEKRNSTKKTTEHIHKSFHGFTFKQMFTVEAIDLATIILLSVVIICAIFFVTYKILNSYKPVVSNKTEISDIAPTWAPENAYFPIGVKAVGAKELPDDCKHASDECWKNSIKNGVVKFIDTRARVLFPGYENREIIFAYFKNQSKVFGTSGLYNCLPMYKDNGEMVGADIFGGINSEIDWVYGTVKGAIFHDKNSGRCVEVYYNVQDNIWSNKAVNCPK